ncbi:unnamed protein product [Mytilus edulis]|uniref:Uncharacterized protein n=1 Tax=Mytilus edulis TaxID=6550 RepID=A0A8S3QMT6_MYTED|nr:unnamed protein product [Mytilus edulis]
MRKGVTKFVLGRIDTELNKLESNVNNTWSESQNDQTRANPYQQNILDTPNYSHNQWHYDDTHSQQLWNFSHTHPQQHGELQSQNIAHENSYHSYEHDYVSFGNLESGQYMCKDNIIEIQPLILPTEPNPKLEISKQALCNDKKLPAKKNTSDTHRNIQPSQPDTALPHVKKDNRYIIYQQHNRLQVSQNLGHI